jgi:hypothetical protein
LSDPTHPLTLITDLYWIVQLVLASKVAISASLQLT